MDIFGVFGTVQCMFVCADLSSYHQSPHSLLLNAFVLFFLLSLCVGVVRGYSFGQLLDLSSYRAMVFLKIFGMLEDAIQIFLKQNKKSENGPISVKLFTYLN